MDESIFLTNQSLDEYDPSDAGSVGAQPGGTYILPDAAQPNNRPWDTPGGTLGQYGSDVLNILKLGVGAWSQYQARQDFLDYKRFEATAGGVYQQGQRAGGVDAQGRVVVQGNNNFLLIILVVGAIFILKK